MTERKPSGAPHDTTEPRKRGSQPGVARGPYKPRINAELDVELEYLLKLHPDFAAEHFDNPGDSKICSACNVELDLSHFSPSKNGRCGVKARCKDCCADVAREYGGTSQGKTARALAQAKFRAAFAAQERERKARAAFIADTGKTPLGRALLAAAGMTHQKDEKC